jgi:hypothetical protein
MLALVMDIAATPSGLLVGFYACTSGVEAHFGYMSNDFDSAQNGKDIQCLTRAPRLA